MVGSPEAQIFDDYMKKPLCLNGTTFGNPSSVTEKSVIPDGDEQKSGWSDALGPLDGYVTCTRRLNAVD